MDDILRLENIKKIYYSGATKVNALNGISFRLNRGEILAIMGSSGSGKSTTLYIIGGLEQPSEGAIYINHNCEKKYWKEPYASEFRSQNIGFIFQSFQLLDDISIEENVGLPLMLQKQSKENIRDKVEEKLRLVGLYGRRKNNPRVLSGGQRQRVAIARAMVTNPKILLADEPTGNLDYNTSLEIMGLIRKMNQELGQSIILVTHDPKIASYADRVLFFHDGRIINELENDTEKDNMTAILNVFQQQYR